MKIGIEDSGRELTPEQVEEIVASMDADGDGFVDIDSFTRWMSGNEVQRLMARMNDLPRPIRFTLAQKEENKVAVVDAAELAREAEPAEEPDEDVTTMSARERFHVENSARTELSDAYKVAAKNSRAETKRAMRSLGADPALSESSQILLELEDQQATDVTQTYEYATEYMVGKIAREAEEEAAREALQRARRDASAKSSAKKRDDGDDAGAEEGGGKKQKRGVGRRKKRGGGGDDDSSAARDGLALSALLGESRAEYDRVIAHAGCVSHSTMRAINLVITVSHALYCQRGSAAVVCCHASAALLYERNANPPHRVHASAPHLSPPFVSWWSQV